jgi:hypothetical protein
VGVRRSPEFKSLHIAFLGHAKVEEENTQALLEDLIPEGREVFVYLPDTIKRNSGLKVVQSILDDWGLDYKQLPVQDAVKQVLVNDDHDYGTLILLLDPAQEEEAAELAELAWAAQEAGIPIRNLCAALDFVELADPEPEVVVDPKAYGTPRNGVTMEVEGPATIVTQPDNIPVKQEWIDEAGAILRDALKNYIRFVAQELLEDWMKEMGLGIGHSAHVTTVAEQQQNVQAWLSGEDSDNPVYERIPDDKIGKRAPKGKRTVTITAEEAVQVGI